MDTIRSSDLVHVHGHPYLSSLIAARLAKKYSKPLVLTQHNTFIQYNGFWNFFERLNDLTIGKEIIKLADKIIVVSNATRKYVLSLGAKSDKITLIHNGVDINRFKLLTKSKAEIRKKLKINVNSKVGLTVRRLVYKNGIDTLLKSAQKVIKRGSNIVFLIIGKGPDLLAIREKVQNLKLEQNIKLLGYISDADLSTYYNAADFFILPSKSGEGLPLVSLEAMACGLPVIATNVGGIKEILEKKYSIVIPPDDSELMGKAILEISQKSFSNKKEDLRALIEQKHSWTNNVMKLLEIYEELI
jgi:glycosyltransferase involved in cell wall biosynthesis